MYVAYNEVIGLMSIVHWVAYAFIKPVDSRVAIPEVCVDFCECDAILSRVDCTGEGLDAIPDTIRNNTRLVVFDFNLLKIIGKTDISRLRNIRYLSLANNTIDEIEESGFRFQRKLVYLDLSGNKFGEVPVALGHLRILRELQLNNNQIRSLSKLPWSNITRLQRLQLNHNGIPNLPVVMTSKLKNLQELSVSHNNITAIPPGQFWNMSNLEYLDLSYNEITTNFFPPATYDAYGSPMNFASDLVTASPDLEYELDNMAEGITVNSFEGLYQLSSLDLSGNNIQELTGGVLNGMDNLQTLHMDSNNMKHIEEDVFDGHLSVQVLTLSNNVLSVLPLSMFENLRTLEVLDLSQNRIEDVTNLTSVHMFQMQSLLLSHNAIRSIPSPGFIEWFHLEELYLANNRLADIPAVSNLTHLKILDLRGNNIKRIVPTDVFAGSSLQELYLGQNRLKKLELNAIVHLQDLRILDVMGDNYECDCSILWVSDLYNAYDWMYIPNDDYGGTIDSTIVCASPPLYQGLDLYQVVVSMGMRLSCTEYIEPHRVLILVLSWGGIVAFFVLCFWTYVYVDFKQRFYVRRPRKRYLLVHNKEYKNASIPLVTGTSDTYGHQCQVRFRSYDSDTESLDMLNCNYDDDEGERIVGDETTV